MRDSSQGTSAVAECRNAETAPVTGPTQVIILAGSPGRESRWTRGIPRPLLPLAKSSLIESLLARLNALESAEYVVCADGAGERISAHLKWASDERTENEIPRIAYHHDSRPRGSAGRLRDSLKNAEAGPILVLPGSLWLEDDPASLIERHRASGNVLTVFSTDDGRGGKNGERVFSGPTTLYCCEPSVLEHIRERGCQDLAGDLIPALQRAGLAVGAAVLNSNTREVNDWASYLHAVARSIACANSVPKVRSQQGADIWAGPDSWIAPNARLVGPIIMGHGCRIESGAAVVGPVVLGNYSVVESGARLIRTVAPSGLKVAPRAITSDCIVVPMVHQAAVGRPAAFGSTSGTSEVNTGDRKDWNRAAQTRGSGTWAGAWIVMAALIGVSCWSHWSTLEVLWIAAFSGP